MCSISVARSAARAGGDVAQQGGLVAAAAHRFGSQVGSVGLQHQPVGGGRGGNRAHLIGAAEGEHAADAEIEPGAEREVGGGRGRR